MALKNASKMASYGNGEISKDGAEASSPMSQESPASPLTHFVPLYPPAVSLVSALTS